MSIQANLFESWLAAQPKVNGNIGRPLFNQAMASDNKEGSGFYQSKTHSVLTPEVDPIVPGQIMLYERTQELAAGSEIEEIPVGFRGVAALAISPDNSTLVAHFSIDSAPGVIWIYSVAMGEDGKLALTRIQELDEDFSNTKIYFTGIDSFIVLDKSLGGEDAEGSVLLYKKNTSGVFVLYSNLFCNANGEVLADVVSLAVSPDYKYVVLNATSNVYLYEYSHRGVRYLSKLSGTTLTAPFLRCMAFTSNTELIAAVLDGTEVETVTYDMMIKYTIADGLLRTSFDFGALGGPVIHKLIPLGYDFFIGVYAANPEGYNATGYHIQEVVNGEDISFVAQVAADLLDETSTPIVFSDIYYNKDTELLYTFGLTTASQKVLDHVGEGYFSLVSTTTNFNAVAPLVIIPTTQGFYTIQKEGELFYFKSVITEFSGCPLYTGIIHPDTDLADSYWIGFANEQISSSPKAWSVQGILKVGNYTVYGS